MLKNLILNNLVTINNINIQFHSGFNVITGETGAGKSIIINSLKLLAGINKIDKNNLFSDKPAIITAVFTIDQLNEDTVMHLNNNCGIIIEQEIIIKRIININKSSSYINDQPVTISTVKNIIEDIIEIHGQFDHANLLKPENHIFILDKYAKIDYQNCKKYWQQFKTIKNKKTELQNRLAQINSQQDTIQDKIADLSIIENIENEEELEQKRRYLLNKQNIFNYAQQTLEIINSNNGLDEQLRLLSHNINKINDLISTPDIINAIDRASIEINEISNIITQKFTDTDNDHDSLEAIEEKFFLIKDLHRKYKTNTLNDLKTLIKNSLQSVTEIEQQINALSKKENETLELYTQAAKNISNQRNVAAKKMSELVNKELSSLKLDHAKFNIEIMQLTQDKYKDYGYDNVNFKIANNLNNKYTDPLKTLSGGEISRLILILKTIYNTERKVKTIIFDEIDSGTSGSVAMTIGKKLLYLAQNTQVISTTHSPQVASKGQYHLQVQKTINNDIVSTTIYYLKDAKAKNEEIAKLISGSEITDEARAAANKLINNE